METPYGPGLLRVHHAASPVTTLLVTHGAGKNCDTRDLLALAAALPGRGITVALFDQPWVVAGKKVASPPATLDVGLVAAVETLSRRELIVGPLVVGGRSAGARAACRTASQIGAVAAVALAFPLHPPGRPEKSRVDELVGSGVPTLVVQGDRDTFGRPDEFPSGTPLVAVPGGDHGFAVLKSGPVSEDAAMSVIVDAVSTWVLGHRG